MKDHKIIQPRLSIFVRPPMSDMSGARILDGRNFALSRAGLVAALADLPPEGGRVIIPPNAPFRFESAETVYILSDNVELIGHPSSPVSGPVSGDCLMICPHGVQGEGATIVTDVAAGETKASIIHGLDLSPGDTILIRDPVDLHTHLAIVTNVPSVNAIEFSDPVTDAFPVAHRCIVHKLQMRKNILVTLWLDGAGSEGNVTGFGASFTQHCRFNINASNFQSKNSYGAFDNYGYANRWEGVFVNCGNMNNALGYSSSSMEIIHCTRTTVRDIHISNSRGFGFSAYFTNHAFFDNVNTSFTTGHGIKIGGSTVGSQCAHCRVSNCSVNYVGLEPSGGTSESGIAYSSGTHDIIEMNCNVQNCSWHGWEACDATVHNIFSTNLVARNNGLLDPGGDIATFGYGLVFNGANYDRRFDRATGTLWNNAFFPTGASRIESDEEAALYRKTIAGRTLGQGRALRFFLAGRLLNATGKSQSFHFALMLGDQVLASRQVGLVSSSDHARAFSIDARLMSAHDSGLYNLALSLSVDQPATERDDVVAPTLLLDSINFALRSGDVLIDPKVHQDFAILIKLSESHEFYFVEADYYSLEMVG